MIEIKVKNYDINEVAETSLELIKGSAQFVNEEYLYEDDYSCEINGDVVTVIFPDDEVIVVDGNAYVEAVFDAIRSIKKMYPSVVINGRLEATLCIEGEEKDAVVVDYIIDNKDDDVVINNMITCVVCGKEVIDNSSLILKFSGDCLCSEECVEKVLSMCENYDFDFDKMGYVYEVINKLLSDEADEWDYEDAIDAFALLVRNIYEEYKNK